LAAFLWGAMKNIFLNFGWNKFRCLIFKLQIILVKEC
jgi:hypothetical protein